MIIFCSKREFVYDLLNCADEKFKNKAKICAEMTWNKTE